MNETLRESIASARVADARTSAVVRRRRQSARLRPLGWAVGVVVAVSAFESEPPPGASGRRLAITLMLIAYLVLLGLLMRGFGNRWSAIRVPLVTALGAAGVALAALQPHGPTEVAASVAVWTAVARFRPAVGLSLAAAVTAGLDITIALTSPGWGRSIAASTLLCVLVGLTAWFMRQAAENQDRTELLLAELEDARERQLQAAALTERGRIARELHDILAHSLSGLAIQIEGTRLLAEHEAASTQLREGLARAGELARLGLAEATHAVGVLHDRTLPSADDLAILVESFRRDFALDAEFHVEGTPCPLAPDTGLALYRAAQETLTNVTRHAPGGRADAVLRYEPGGVRLRVDNSEPTDEVSQTQRELGRAGGGKGLEGLRERVHALGGTVNARPTGASFSVSVWIPFDRP